MRRGARAMAAVCFFVCLVAVCKLLLLFACLVVRISMALVVQVIGMLAV